MKTALATLLFTASALVAAPIATGTFTLTGVNGASVDGFYTAPYFGTLTTPAGSVDHAVYCDDFLDQVAVGQTWDVNVFSGSDLAGTYFSDDPNYVAIYPQRFWLVESAKLGLINAAAASQALWTLSDPTYLGSMESNALIAASVAGALTINPALFLVLDGIPTSAVSAAEVHRPQEMIVSLNPEPSTLFLMSGAALMIWVAQRKKVS